MALFPRVRNWRATWPDNMHRPSVRLAAWTELLIQDFGLLRYVFNRPKEISPGVYRMTQPTPSRLRRLSRRGVRTVINLRGASHRGRYLLEQWECQKLGLHLVDLKLSSRRPPHAHQVHELHRVFADNPGNWAFHCKSGADRAGLVAALYQIFQGVPVSTAKQQLSWRYWHIRQSPTGVLDHFLECYEREGEHSAEGFWYWLDNVYDRDRVMKTFQPAGWAAILVDRVLRRE